MPALRVMASSTPRVLTASDGACAPSRVDLPRDTRHLVGVVALEESTRAPRVRFRRTCLDGKQHYARRGPSIARLQSQPQGDRPRLSAHLLHVHHLAAKVLVSLAYPCPPPLAGLADGIFLRGQCQQGRGPEVVGSGSSLVARATIGVGSSCCVAACRA